MIYKFKFEVYDNDNIMLLSSRSEESGDFWWAFREFIVHIINYARGV